MTQDLAAFVRSQMRQAAAEFILEQAATVADEITNASIDGELASIFDGGGDLDPIVTLIFGRDSFGDGGEHYDTIAENYVPEVEMGGARHFGEGSIIGREERKEAMRAILHNLTGQYADLAAWVEAVARESSPEADQDPGDSQPADLAGAGQAPVQCVCQRRLRNGGVCDLPCSGRCGLYRL